MTSTSRPERATESVPTTTSSAAAAPVSAPTGVP